MVRITKTSAQAQKEKELKIQEEIKNRTCPECGAKASHFNIVTEDFLYEKVSLFRKVPYQLNYEKCSNSKCGCEWEWKSYV